MFNILIFSRDRAAQLDALLRSIQENFVNYKAFKFCILYTYSCGFFKQGYQLLIKRFPEFEFILESDFKKDTSKAIKDKNRFTIFGHDDSVFVDKFDTTSSEFTSFVRGQDVVSLSLWMHPGMVQSYGKGCRIELPDFASDLSWKWRGQKGDWGKPFSTNFTIFKTKDIINVIRNEEYINVNLLEWFISRINFKKERAVCFSAPVVINIPVNSVQSVTMNKAVEISLDRCNVQYLNNKKIVLDLDKSKFNSTQIETQFRFENYV